LLVKINAEKNHQLMFYWIPFVLSLMRMCHCTSLRLIDNAFIGASKGMSVSKYNIFAYLDA
jgi:hypothetical protein